MLRSSIPAANRPALSFGPSLLSHHAPATLAPSPCKATHLPTFKLDIKAKGKTKMRGFFFSSSLFKRKTRKERKDILRTSEKEREAWPLVFGQEEK